MLAFSIMANIPELSMAPGAHRAFIRYKMSGEINVEDILSKWSLPRVLALFCHY